MKVKALVNCTFEIEYEDKNDDCDINITKENIMTSNVQELIDLETDGSIQIVRIIDIGKVK